MIESFVNLRHDTFVRFTKYLLMAAVAAGLAGCSKSSMPSVETPVAVDDSEPTHAQPKLRTLKLYLGPEALDTELALTERQERIGMMFRTNIQDTDAMLFVFPAPQQVAFWMKNCPESISAAYITTDGTIAEIHHLEMNDTNPVYAVTNNIQFVLETQEGWFGNHHINVGMVIRTEKGSLPDTFFRRRH